MFTGLIEAIGEIRSVRKRGQGLSVTVAHRARGDWKQGESVSVNGCCLTALNPTRSRFDADLSPETLKRTGGAKSWRRGRRLNLERSLRLGDRLGGHLVSGHVDTQLRVIALSREPGEWARLTVALSGQARVWTIEKGSIAIDGVSLTIARWQPNRIELALIPETLEATNLGELRAGDRVNVEFDMLAKYATRAARAPRRKG